MSYYIWHQSSCVHLENSHPSCFPLLFFKIIVPIGRQAAEPSLSGLLWLHGLYILLHSWWKDRCRYKTAKKLRPVREGIGWVYFLQPFGRIQENNHFNRLLCHTFVTKGTNLWQGITPWTILSLRNNSTVGYYSVVFSALFNLQTLIPLRSPS